MIDDKTLQSISHLTTALVNQTHNKQHEHQLKKYTQLNLTKSN